MRKSILVLAMIALVALFAISCDNKAAEPKQYDVKLVYNDSSKEISVMENSTIDDNWSEIKKAISTDKDIDSFVFEVDDVEVLTSKKIESSITLKIIDLIKISTTEEFENYIKTGGRAILNSDITYGVKNELKDGKTVSKDFLKNMKLDLNKKKLTLNSSISLYGKNTMELFNGTVLSDTGYDLKYAGIQVFAKSKLILTDVIFNSETTGLFAVNNENDTVIKLERTTLTSKGYYGIGTNATPKESQNVKFIIKDSEVSTKGAANGDNSAILFNVKGGVDIENSTISGDRHAVILRGGVEHSIANSNLEVTGHNAVNDEYVTKDWKSGNEVPLAALVIGNRSSSYKYPTVVKLEDVVISAPEKNKSNKDYYGIYIYQNDATNTVNVSGTVKDYEKIKINDKKNGATVSVK